MKQIKGIWLPDDDTHFEAHLDKGPIIDGCGTYQLKKLQAAVGFVPESQRGLAVDVGAHVGLWTRVLATMFDCVAAFEPHPTLYACWERNCQGFENVDGYNFALSNADDYISIAYVEGNSGNAHAVDKNTKGAHRTRSTRLDSFPIDRKIDFMKIDVEGWELFVLQGAEKTIQQDKPIIILEQKPGNAERFNLKRTAALEYLLARGYKLVWEKSGDYVVQYA